MTSIQIDRRLPDRFFERSLRADVAAGLAATPKWLAPKWFYDERGSELFDKITMLDEYYPTRTEREILAAVAPEIIRLPTTPATTARDSDMEPPRPEPRSVGYQRAVLAWFRIFSGLVGGRGPRRRRDGPPDRSSGRPSAP